MPSSKSSLDKRDVYYRKGKSDGYRARSAYKLLHLDEEFDLFRGVDTAVDLCAAPGSWSQVLGKRLRPGTTSNRVVSVDLQPMAPLPGITTIQADITRPNTVPRVIDALGGRKAHLVVCDGAPDVTGVHDLDAYLHSQLLLAALTLALTLMAPSATLIFKIFLSPLDPTASVLRSQLRAFFPGPAPGESAQGGGDFEEFDGDSENVAEPDVPSSASASTTAPGYDAFGRRGGVWVRKPRSSRKGSGEAFIVCRNFDPSTLPLPVEFSFASLDALRNQVGGTLTLESLGTLASTGPTTPDGDWQTSKAFVGGGDLDAGLHPAASGHALTLNVDHRRDTSIGSIEGAPSPVESHFGAIPPPHSLLQRTPTVDKNTIRRRNISDAALWTPQQLPSPALSALDGGTHREFHQLSSSPLNGFSLGSGYATPGGFGSPGPLSPGSRERDVFATTPQADGAISPALSSSSKTDTFFATSQRETLPIPPKPLSSSLGRSTSIGSASSLGRSSSIGSSIGRGLPPHARSRVVTTPAGHVEALLSTSPTSPSLIAPTPLRSVTGPAPSCPTPPTHPASVPADVLLSPSSRSRPTTRETQHSIAREQHHSEPDEQPVRAGDILVAVPDDPSLPIRSSDSPGQWRLISRLGSGAFASVWSAQSATSGEVSAVKLVARVVCARNARTASAFYREVEVLRHLVHQGIVSYVAHFSTGTHHCLVLERLQGGELFSVVEDEACRRRMLQPSSEDPEGQGLMRRIFGELSRAVSWLHEVEVVHRDIKLENILFTVNPFSLPPTASGSVDLAALPVPLIKLTDFGLSRFIRTDNPLLQTRCGSESYAAPEVVMGNLYDGRRTDAWALGVVLYALAAGELPFDDGAPAPAGRNRAGSNASVTSVTDSVRDVRRRTMHRIAKGEYGWRDGVGTLPLRSVVAHLLTRDPSRRARVAQLWDMEWMSSGAGAVPRPSEPMPPRLGILSNRNGYAEDHGVVEVNGIALPRRASDAPHVVVQQGVLVDHERIDDVARAEQT